MLIARVFQDILISFPIREKPGFYNVDINLNKKILSKTMEMSNRKPSRKLFPWLW